MLPFPVMTAKCQSNKVQHNTPGVILLPFFSAIDLAICNKTESYKSGSFLRTVKKGANLWKANAKDPLMI